MDRDRLLGTVSTVQLGAGVAGMAIAVRRRHTYDLPLLHGRPDKVARDSIIVGTALSAPVTMLTAQAIAAARVLYRPTPRARQLLGMLGAVMVIGYLAEQHVRQRLRPSSWDTIESPLIVLGISAAGAMATLARTRQLQATNLRSTALALGSQQCHAHITTQESVP
jgi:hypothetical protein